MAKTYYTWDRLSDNVLMESDENGDTIATYSHDPRQYGRLLSQRRGDTTSNYHFDAMGNTRAITQNGNVTDRYTFSAFGKEVSRTGSTVNPWGYQGAVGYYANPGTEDLYVRARHYRPSIGRWLSKDPTGYDDDINRYRYAENLPIRFSDPSGLASFDCYCKCITTVGEELYETRTTEYLHRVSARTNAQANAICNSDCVATNWGRGIYRFRRCTGRASRIRFPEFDPSSPGTVAEGTRLKIKLDSILWPSTVCGLVRPTHMSGCTERIRWHEEVRHACTIPRLALGTSLCSSIQERIEDLSDTPNMGYEMECPRGMTCCLKKKYNGIHAVTLSFSRLSAGPGCSVSLSFHATITFRGDVGACK